MPSLGGPRLSERFASLYLSPVSEIPSRLRVLSGVALIPYERFSRHTSEWLRRETQTELRSCSRNRPANNSSHSLEDNFLRRSRVLVHCKQTTESCTPLLARLILRYTLVYQRFDAVGGVVELWSSAAEREFCAGDGGLVRRILLVNRLDRAFWEFLLGLVHWGFGYGWLVVSVCFRAWVSVFMNWWWSLVEGWKSAILVLFCARSVSFCCGGALHSCGFTSGGGSFLTVYVIFVGLALFKHKVSLRWLYRYWLNSEHCSSSGVVRFAACDEQLLYAGFMSTVVSACRICVPQVSLISRWLERDLGPERNLIVFLDYGSHVNDGSLS